MNYRTVCVNNAVNSIHDAIAAIKSGRSESALIFLGGALKSLHNGLEIGPSEQAIAELLADKKDAA